MFRFNCNIETLLENLQCNVQAKLMLTEKMSRSNVQAQGNLKCSFIFHNVYIDRRMSCSI